MEKIYKSYWVADQNQTGNFSNDQIDTFDPDNDYIGVRLQQGVPLLDRDWNELEDIRRYQEISLRQNYIGDGTPDDGFKISSSSGNNFKIGSGRYLVGGFEVINRDTNLLYPGNPSLSSLAAGTTLSTWRLPFRRKGPRTLKTPSSTQMMWVWRHASVISSSGR